MTDNLKFGLWCLAGLAIAALTLSLQFRGAIGDWQTVTFDANGARWLLAAAAGALLGLGGHGAPERWLHPLCWLIASTAAAAGVTVAWLWAPHSSTAAFVGLSAGLAVGLLATRWHAVFSSNSAVTSLVVAVFCLALAASGFYLASLNNAAPNTAQALLRWAIGGVDHAHWLAAALACVGVLVVSLRNMQLVNTPLASLALATGLVGPIAFVAWFIPGLVQRVTPFRDDAKARLLCALGGAVLLLTVDAAQRYAIGGYGQGLNLPLTLLGVPFLLWWQGGRLRQASAVLLAAITAYAVWVVIRLIQTAT